MPARRRLGKALKFESTARTWTPRCNLGLGSGMHILHLYSLLNKSDCRLQMLCGSCGLRCTGCRLEVQSSRQLLARRRWHSRRCAAEQS